MTNKEFHRALDAAATGHGLGACRAGAAALTLGAMMVAGGALAPAALAEVPEECLLGPFCTGDGFTIDVEVEDDANAGTRTFIYEICAGDGSLVDGEECGPPENGLSNFQLSFPLPCVEGGDVSIEGLAFDNEVFSGCAASAPGGLRNQCPPDIEAGDQRIQCEVGVDDWKNPGDCTFVSVTVTGEPFIGTGGTKAAANLECVDVDGVVCELDECIPDSGDDCLTRTLGYWGRHPKVTEAYLEIDVCGVTLNTIDVGTQGSALEDVCADTKVRKGKNKEGDPSFQVFIAQLAAAKLNIAASVDEGGSCDETLAAALEGSGCDFASLVDLEADQCGKTGNALSACIAALDDFNNWQDGPSFTSDLPNPFVDFRRAEPAACQEAIRNGFVNTR